MHGSDPEILYLIGAATTSDWSKPKVLPTAIKGLLLYPEKFEFSDIVADLMVSYDLDLEIGAAEEIISDEIEVIEISDDDMQDDDSSK